MVKNLIPELQGNEFVEARHTFVLRTKYVLLTREGNKKMVLTKMIQELIDRLEKIKLGNYIKNDRNLILVEHTVYLFNVYRGLALN